MPSFLGYHLSLLRISVLRKKDTHAFYVEATKFKQEIELKMDDMDQMNNIIINIFDKILSGELEIDIAFIHILVVMDNISEYMTYSYYKSYIKLLMYFSFFSGLGENYTKYIVIDKDHNDYKCNYALQYCIEHYLPQIKDCNIKYKYCNNKRNKCITHIKNKLYEIEPNTNLIELSIGNIIVDFTQYRFQSFFSFIHSVMSPCYQKRRRNYSKYDTMWDIVLSDEYKIDFVDEFNMFDLIYNHKFINMSTDIRVQCWENPKDFIKLLEPKLLEPHLISDPVTNKLRLFFDESFEMCLEEIKNNSEIYCNNIHIIFECIIQKYFYKNNNAMLELLKQYLKSILFILKKLFFDDMVGCIQIVSKLINYMNKYFKNVIIVKDKIIASLLSTLKGEFDRNFGIANGTSVYLQFNNIWFFTCLSTGHRYSKFDKGYNEQLQENREKEREEKELKHWLVSHDFEDIYLILASLRPLGLNSMKNLEENLYKYSYDNKLKVLFYKIKNEFGLRDIKDNECVKFIRETQSIIESYEDDDVINSISIGEIIELYEYDDMKC